MPSGSPGGIVVYANLETYCALNPRHRAASQIIPAAPASPMHAVAASTTKSSSRAWRPGAHSCMISSRPIRTTDMAATNSRCCGNERPTERPTRTKARRGRHPGPAGSAGSSAADRASQIRPPRSGLPCLCAKEFSLLAHSTVWRLLAQRPCERIPSNLLPHANSGHELLPNLHGIAVGGADAGFIVDPDRDERRSSCR